MTNMMRNKPPLNNILRLNPKVQYYENMDICLLALVSLKSRQVYLKNQLGFSLMRQNTFNESAYLAGSINVLCNIRTTDPPFP